MYLGQILSTAGYKPDISNIEAIRVLETSKPRTVGEVRKLLVLQGRYLRYVKDIPRIAHPLLQLLKSISGDTIKPIKQSKSSPSHGTVTSSQLVVWKEWHQNASEELLGPTSFPGLFSAEERMGTHPLLGREKP